MSFNVAKKRKAFSFIVNKKININLRTQNNYIRLEGL